jgi:C4-dicarboxylate-specific signal transduction histidine kinase
MGDPVLLSWAFENLLKNSIDATATDKGQISVNLVNEDGVVSILFKDNGKGIKRKNWNDIFRPGFSTKKRGWGLGLSLTQRIVKDIHRGEISVLESSANGTVITARFPKR